jgi:type I restriction enzyme S subunit
MNAIENISLSKVGELRMGETIIEKDCTGEGLPIYSADKSNRPWAYSTHFKRLNQYGTIVLGARGTIGYPRLPKEAVFGATQTTITLRPDSEKFVPEFIYYALQQLDFSLLSAQQAIPMLTVGNLEAVSVPRYPYPEQSKIAEVLSKVDQAIEQTESLIAKQQRIKTGLMQDLLTRGIDEHGNLRSEETHEFKDSPLGRIPVEWKTKQLIEITPSNSPIGYGIVQPGAYDYKGVKVAGIYTINSQFRDWHMSSAKIEQAYVRSRIVPGDVLLSIKGTTGRVGVVPSGITGNISREIARIRPVKEINPQYLKWLMLSDFFQRYLSNAEVGTTRAELSIKILREMFVLQPPFPEQNEIAKRISSAEKLIKTSSISLDKLKCLKTALMQDLLTGKKRVTPLMENMEVCS